MNRYLVGAFMICIAWHPATVNRSYSCTMQDISKLHNQLRKYEAAVLFFYDGSCRKTAKRVRRFQQALAQVAQSGIYPDKALVFISLDVTKSLTQLFMQDHDIFVVNKVPTLILFKNGVIIQDQHGVVMFNEEPSRSSIRRFIDNYLALDIAQHVRQERALKRYKSVMRDRMHVYYTPYFSKIANPWNDWWGWPYYGMAQGNYGGNVGVNFFASNY